MTKEDKLKLIKFQQTIKSKSGQDKYNFIVENAVLLNKKIYDLEHTSKPLNIMNSILDVAVSYKIIYMLKGIANAYHNSNSQK